MLRLQPSAEVPRKGKILFAARFWQSQNFAQPSTALNYLAPPLRRAGYEVVLSETVVCPRDSYTFRADELRRITTSLQREVEAEKPLFVAFPVYDYSSRYVFETARSLSEANPQLALVFGASFIAINPRQSAEIFGGFPNAILINGEAEYALPQALNAFLEGRPTDAAGMFIRKNSQLLGGRIFQQISLTEEEHEGLEVNLDFQGKALFELGGIDLTTSRGCQEGCAICAASSVFRGRYVAWSTENRLAKIAATDAWMRQQGWAGSKTNIGLIDDSFLYMPDRSIDFLRAFGASPLSERINLMPQISFGSLFRPDGSFIQEIADSMLRPDGQPFVNMINVGGDFWAPGERMRNKGGRNKKLTNDQIRTAIGALVRNKIMVHSYWIVGDEHTSVYSFGQGLFNLAEMQLDFAPYFSVDFPEPLALYTGTPLRFRVLSAANLPSGYLKVISQLGEGGNAIKFYEPLFPISDLVNFIYDTVIKLNLRIKKSVRVSPEMFLVAMTNLAKKWRTEVLTEKERGLVIKYLRARQSGQAREKLLKEDRALRQLNSYFSFFVDHNFQVAELLALVELCEKLPSYYHADGHGYFAEIRRRHPNFEAEQAAVLEKIKQSGGSIHLPGGPGG